MATVRLCPIFFDISMQNTKENIYPIKINADTENIAICPCKQRNGCFFFSVIILLLYEK